MKWNEWRNECMNEWMNEWRNEWMNEWRNEMNEWMNDCLRDHKSRIGIVVLTLLWKQHASRGTLSPLGQRLLSVSEKFARCYADDVFLAKPCKAKHQWWLTGGNVWCRIWTNVFPIFSNGNSGDCWAQCQCMKFWGVPPWCCTKMILMLLKVGPEIWKGGKKSQFPLYFWVQNLFLRGNEVARRKYQKIVIISIILEIPIELQHEISKSCWIHHSIKGAVDQVSARVWCTTNGGRQELKQRNDTWFTVESVCLCRVPLCIFHFGIVRGCFGFTPSLVCCFSIFWFALLIGRPFLHGGMVRNDSFYENEMITNIEKVMFRTL